MTFGIVGNTFSKAVPGAVFEFLREIGLHRIDHVIEKHLYDLIRKKHKFHVPPDQTKNASEITSSSDFIVSFGGDGTFLSTARLVGKSGKPIIGINLGKLGFLADVRADEAVQFILNVRKKKFKIVERTVLEASFEKSKRKLYALNEVVVGKVSSVRTILISAFYNDKFVVTYHADGLIISTPTGSTAYSMSAGGPIINPRSKVFVLSPICAHTLMARPIVLPDDGAIRIEVISRIPIIATSDGNDTINLGTKTVVKIKKANYVIKLVKSPDSNYFDVLNKKLLLGQDVRK